MAKNAKKTSAKVASTAGKVLADPNASKIQRRLAASSLSQVVPGRQTGSDLEADAAKALDNPNSAETTKTLAATVVSQSNKKR